MLAGLASGLTGAGGGGLSDSGSATSSGEQRSSFGGVTIGVSGSKLSAYAIAGALALVLVVVLITRR